MMTTTATSTTSTTTYYHSLNINSTEFDLFHDKAKIIFAASITDQLTVLQYN